MNALDQAFHTMLDELILWVPKVPAGLLVFFAFWLCSVLVRKIFLRIVSCTEFNTRYVLQVVGRTHSIAILLLGGITALGTIGINVSALVAGLSLTSFALGFGLKDILANLVSGLLILLHRPFSLNEQISVAGMEGVVPDIDLRYTRLEQAGKAYLIPNLIMITDRIGLLSMRGNAGGGNSTTGNSPVKTASAAAIIMDESVTALNGNTDVTDDSDDSKSSKANEVPLVPSPGVIARLSQLSVSPFSFQPQLVSHLQSDRGSI
ncbi:MAG: mechanosensitive ion channel family protein [Nitrospiraceae bacterium]